jgi:hypothetical protein
MRYVAIPFKKDSVSGSKAILNAALPNREPFLVAHEYYS